MMESGRTVMSKKVIAVVLALALVAGVLVYNSDAMRERRIINALVAQNIEARGGEDAWQAVDTLRLTGQMDLGQGMHVPYVMVQKRPSKMCLEFVFDEKTAIQCINGETGWKLLPFRGRNYAEAMTDQEHRAMAGAVSIDGLLVNAVKRGGVVKLVGKDVVAGRSAAKLEVTLPSGKMHWVYIDDETGLDLKVETTRLLRGQERIVETFFYDWQETDGLLIPRRQESRTQGDDDFHFVTVDSVLSNPSLDDARFAMPEPGEGGSS
jgi:hypothetical protein